MSPIPPKGEPRLAHLDSPLVGVTLVARHALSQEVGPCLHGRKRHVATAWEVRTAQLRADDFREEKRELGVY